MTNRILIELSDTCIRASQSGSQIYAEPGIALLSANKTPVIGSLAQNSLRQQPTRIYSQFWSDLSSEPLQINDSGVRHSADLVWHQLSNIKTQINLQQPNTELTLCVASNMSQAQMQLLSGICQSLELKVDYLVNTGLAQIVSSQLDATPDKNTDKITHIDLQLHQLVLSNYHVTPTGIALAGQESVQSISFLKLIDRLLHRLRDKFIQGSRFDPLHSGETEQQLFDQLILLFETGKLAPFQVDTAQKVHRIELSIQELSESVCSVISDINTRLLDSGLRAYAPLFSALPGFKPENSDILLDQGNTVSGATLLSSLEDSSDGINYISSYLSSTALKDTSFDSKSPHTASTLDSTNDKKPDNSANALIYVGHVYTANELTLLQELMSELEAQTDLIHFSEGVLRIANSLETEIRINGNPALAGQELVFGDNIEIDSAHSDQTHSVFAARIAD